MPAVLGSFPPFSCPRCTPWEPCMSAQMWLRATSRTAGLRMGGTQGCDAGRPGAPHPCSPPLPPRCDPPRDASLWALSCTAASQPDLNPNSLFVPHHRGGWDSPTFIFSFSF